MDDQDKIQQRVVITQSGQQVFIQDTPGAAISFHLPGDPIVEEKSADKFTISELQDIFKKSKPSKTQSATISKNISNTPGISKDTDQMQTDKQIKLPRGLDNV